MTSAFSWQNSIIFALLHSTFQGQICLLLYLLTSYFCIPVPYNEKDVSFGVLVIEDLVGLHRTNQLQLLQHNWSGHGLGLLWYRMVCLGNKQRSFCCFWDCIQVLHFGLLLTEHTLKRKYGHKLLSKSMSRKGSVSRKNRICVLWMLATPWCVQVTPPSVLPVVPQGSAAPPWPAGPLLMCFPRLLPNS